MVPWPGQIVGGQIQYQGEDLLTKTDAEMRKIRGSELSIVIQGVRAGLNPLIPVGDQVKNVYRAHRTVSEKEAWRRVVEMFDLVALPDPERVARSYPHELSGGMAQRVIIATALVCSPKILIADEPTTGLDVTVQIQILDLLKDVSTRLATSTVIVTHDLSVVAQYCQKVAVLYAGELVEQAPVAQLFRQPLHPYTIALLDASSYDRVGQRPRRAGGTSAPIVTAGENCPYHARCPIALPVCQTARPPLEEVAPDSFTRCFRAAELVRPDASLRETLVGPRA
jgi:oligopeptide/dipeptide ABC transporter ATP-binding protein